MYPFRTHVLGGAVGILAFIIVTVFGLALVDRLALGTQNLASVISAVLIDITNSDRSDNFLGGLVLNPVLTAAAQAKANDMATKEYFAHVSPEGKDSWYWFKEAGYSFLYAGENLAVDFSDSIDVERAWMNSNTHRANILNENFTEIGIATAHGSYQGRPTTFVVQMFGTPSRMTQVATEQVLAIITPESPTEIAAANTEETMTAVLGAEADSILPVSPSWWQHLLASPKTMLRYIYYAFTGVILVLLALVTELEFHRRHLRHVIASAILLVLMAGLFTLADLIFFVRPVIAAP